MAIMNPSKLRNCYDALPHSNLSDTKQKALEALIMKYLNGEIVPVVRCKDCKNYNQNPYSKEDEKWCMCWSDWIPTEPDDFCSYGERKADD